MKNLNIGMIGYGFMGRAHSNGYNRGARQAADTNADIQFMLNDCVPRGFVWRDRDWWERDRMYYTPGYWDRYRLR